MGDVDSGMALAVQPTPPWDTYPYTPSPPYGGLYFLSVLSFLSALASPCCVSSLAKGLDRAALEELPELRVSTRERHYADSTQSVVAFS